jgi:primosomal protein N' (replication factor Y) (superfamily II helicase)
VACGPGVERLAEEVATTFPEARTIVLSSDFPGGTERLKAGIQAVADGEFQIVIGTQLVAKGHNFPGMTLVGVIDADIGLASGDPRAAERTFPGAAAGDGRAGRGDRPGRALLAKPFQPRHPVIKALLSGDPEQFYQHRDREREAAGLPPFGRLAALMVSAAEQERCRAPCTRSGPLGGGSGRGHGARAGGGTDRAACAVGIGSGCWSRRTVQFDLQTYLREWLKRAPKARGSVRVQVDVDPQSFF